MIILIILIILLGKSKIKTKTNAIGIEFKNVGELVTQKCMVEIMEDMQEDRKFFNKFHIPLTTSRKLFSYVVDVDASIKFDEVDIKKIDYKNKKIEIEIPHAKVYNASIDTDEFKSYPDSESLFSRIDSNEYNEALKERRKYEQ